jgi:hypothetical protein
MKRNNLTTAVVAGIAGVAGIASVSNAVNLNSDGVGQVLVYPYYTVNNGLNTLISVVNTTDETKAVKVRFLEGKNSRECLDFNVYMSPYDVWTAGLVPAVATAPFSGPYAGDDTVKIITFDNTCVFPTAIKTSGYEFLPWGFDPQGNGSLGDGYDRGGQDLARCTEGHFEMIEMGVLENSGDINSVRHNAAGVPNCGAISSNWAVGGKWNLDNNADIGAPTGGLFGSASLIDVERGVDVAYNADAIQAYSISANQTDPGSVTPSLSSGGVFTSNIFNNGEVVTDVWETNSVQAVSALYMHDRVYGEYVLTDSIGANTEWVVTFPTKYAYVDTFKNDFVSYPYEPFTESFQGGQAGTACEEYGISYWDREEQVPGVEVGPALPSPLPPGIVEVTPQFCWETNVLELHDGEFDETLASEILGSNLNTHVATQATAGDDPVFFDTGWIALSFSQGTDDNFRDVTYGGLPVTGFAVQRYVNASDPSGAKNYAGLFKHRYARNIISS